MTTANATPANGEQALVAVGTAQASLPAPQLDVVDSQTRAIGLIMPPHDIRMIIDKTADFVAKNGTSPALRPPGSSSFSMWFVYSALQHTNHAAGTAFEQKILAQPKNVKFNFLHTTDPYHKYYQYKITEVKDGPEAAKAQFQASNSSTAAQPAEAAPQVEEEAPPPTQELKRPDDEKYTAHIPAGLSPQVGTPTFLATVLHGLQSFCGY